jgi:hypothetical protein
MHKARKLITKDALLLPCVAMPIKHPNKVIVKKAGRVARKSFDTTFMLIISMAINAQ